MYSKKMIYPLVGVIIFLVNGCFLFEEEKKQPDVATVRTNSYTLPAGYFLYVTVRNLTTETKNVAVWGKNLSTPLTPTKSFGGGFSLTPSLSTPIMGLPPSFQYHIPTGNWRASFSSSKATFTFGSSPPINYGENPSNWTIGTTKLNFWVVNIQANKYSNITATLRAIGTNMTTGASPSSVAGGVAYIFVDDNDWGTRVTPTIVTQIATNFNGANGIYAKLTNILGGYEDGGGPGGDGGVDANKNIYILLHDIQDGYSGSGGFVGGYYAPINDFPTNYQPPSTTFSSMKQMFVIDAYPTLTSYPGFGISTLIHEAQHMINFGQKYFIGGVQEETWLNEACSMMVEDILDEFVPSADRVYVNNSRMSYFVSEPERGLLRWSDDDDVLYDYGKAYAYLAFVARNTTPRIVKEIVSGVGRNKTGGAAVEAALSAVGAGKTFKESIRLWQKANIYNTTSLSSSWTGYRTNASLSGYELRALDLNSYNNDRSSTGPVLYYFRSAKNVFTFDPYSTFIFKGVPTSGSTVTVYISDDPQIEVEAIITNL
ncbi:MAG: hypothetical protein N2314_04910 [Brevinematales bacterium]|nr:hypothetical protein [Brevinematales bacterium]